MFAISWAVLFLLASYLAHRSLPLAGLWLLPLTVALGLSVGLLRPSLMHRPYRLVERLLAPVGRMFSLAMLALVYFGVFTPFAAVLRRCGWDPLRLRPARRSDSAWVSRPAAAESSDFHWQY